MNIGGFQPFSLSDFPGRVSALVFTQGCNFRCPYCHNRSLIPLDAPASISFTQWRIMEFLTLRQDQLDGVVITGGEPTLQPDVADFAREVKSMGLEIKLDTNGSRPDMLEPLLKEGILDHVAMDIKAPLETYDRLSGVSIDNEKIMDSIRLIRSSGIEHEFRTTAIDHLLTDNDLAIIKNLVPEGSPYIVRKDSNAKEKNREHSS